MNSGRRHLLYCKWALKIIERLSTGPKRPSELKKEINGISDRILYSRLHSMCAAGLLIKRSNNKYPLITLYKLGNKKFIKLFVCLLRNLNIEIDIFVSIISKKWTLEIMQSLRQAKTRKEILSELSNLTDKILYKRLSELEIIGYVSREVKKTKPLTVYYRLTEEGYKALPVLNEARKIILST